MIRRTTPNKYFFKQDRSSSCCECFTFNQTKNQTQITLQNKPAKIKFSKNTSAAHPQEEVPDEKVYRTPIKVNHSTRRSSGKVNQSTWPTDRITAQMNKQPMIILNSSQGARNPLLRLRRPNKTKVQAPEKVAHQPVRPKQISFTYITSRKQVFSRDDCSTVGDSLKKRDQVQVIEQSQVRIEIDNLRKQYEALLMEQKQLKCSKQTNLQNYQRLIADLIATKSEIKILQKLRKEDIQELKAQVQKYAAERQLTLPLK